MTPPSPIRVLQNVQVLRAIAALMVVGAHLGGPTGFENKNLGGYDFLHGFHQVGATGVDLFFIISGFIMVMTTSRVTHGVGGARQFIWRRITRIYPPYLVITAAIFAVYLVKPDLVNSSQETPPDILASFLLLPQAGLPLLLVGWTLVFEMYFYVIFALSLLVPKGAMPYILAGWAVATAALGFVASDNPFVVLAQSPLNFEFLLGAIVGAFAVRRRMPLPSVVAVVGVVAALVVAVLLWNGTIDIEDSFVRVVTAGVACALIVYGLVGLEQAGRFVAPSGLARFGDYSYSLYLTHVLTLAVLGMVVRAILPINPATHILGLLLAVAACTGVGIAYYYAVERPLVRLFHRRPSAPKPPPVAAPVAPPAPVES
jgi:peptidoglycan/LPS O-acetylase OafA/YrhL